MLKKIISCITLCLFYVVPVTAQDDVYPAKKQEGTIIITNGTIHTVTGDVINNGNIVIKEGKIVSVGTANAEQAGATLIDAKGKNVYPGLILCNTDLGLKEIGSGVRGSNDYRELGEYNPSIRSILAYNADSRIINTLRNNGILLACVAPQGSLLTGTSTVVQLDAWNWQDAIYKADNGMHLNIPMLMKTPERFSRSPQAENPLEEGTKKIREVEKFFKEAQAYIKENNRKEKNLKFESLRPLFEKKQKLFIHADIVKQILIAVEFAKNFNIDIVLVGGEDSHLVAGLLKENNIPVVLHQSHGLPVSQDDDIDQPFKTPAALQKAGVLFAINDDADNTRYRNLPFNAGTAAAYGLTKEEALKAITINPAIILGIDKQAGSIEKGKDANIVICEGDILDMRSNKITDAFIQGRKLNLTDKQTQLFDRYKYKYGLK